MGGLAGRRGRIAVVAALLAVAFGLRVVAEEPGPLFVGAGVVAGFLLGRWAGLAAGILGGALYAVAQQLGPGVGDLLPGTPIRMLVGGASGYAIGWLAEERARLHGVVAERDRELGELHAIQEALTPPVPPRRPGLSVATRYVPARDGAGGDFYLVTHGPEEDVTIVAVGDVVGKGVDAARRAAYVRTAIATAAPFEDDPCRLLELANQSLIERAAGFEFVTAACLAYDRAESKVRWALAGHPPPLLLDRGAVLEDGAHASGPLGLDPQLSCAAGTTRLASGSGLLLFTDGLPEARRPGEVDSMLGEERVEGLVAELRGAPPDSIVERLQQAAEECSGEGLADDLCVVALRVD